MPERNDIVDPKGGPTSPTPAETRSAKKARLAEVLDRGIIGNTLTVTDIPDDKHVEWVHRADITKKQALGFEVETELGKDKALHNDGTDRVIVGDVVLMSCSLETKEIIDEIKREKYAATHSPKKGKQKEEREFEEKVDVTSKPSIESSVRSAKKQDITEAIEAANKQKLQ